MSNGLRDVAIVGVGATDYYKRGESWPRTTTEMACEAILAACADAGIDVKDIDGFAYYSGAGAGYGQKMDTADFMETLGIDEVTFTASLTSGGGGAAGSIGLARAAIVAGDATVVVTVMTLQQAQARLGRVFAITPPTPQNAFLQPSGLSGPGHLMSVLARRHMHLYGTTRDAFCEIAMTERENAQNRPKARFRGTPMTREDYFNARMIAEPLCLFDFCQETDGAVAVITTSMDRARDLKQKPVPVVGVAHGGARKWGRAFGWMGMPDEFFASAGNKPIADRLWKQTGLTASDIDVALLYDHFSPMVLMQLEDYGFCERGQGNDFVLDGNIRYCPDPAPGQVPVNTHGGQLSEAYIIGMTHILEGVEQMRGVAVNQVEGAEHALVTGGPAHLPVSGLILGRDN